MITKMDNYEQRLAETPDLLLTIQELPKEEQLKALQMGKKPRSKVSNPSEPKPVSPYRTEEYKAFQAKELAVINDPSIFPEDAELPIHASGEINTRYIQDALFELRRNEPLIEELTRKQLFDSIWLYTQRIQTYAMGPSAHPKICGAIDPRFVQWAEAVAGKVRAREAILKKRDQIAEARKTTNPKKPRRNRKMGYERRIAEYSRPLKALLRKIDFLPEEAQQLTSDTLGILTHYFEERSARYAKRNCTQTTK